MRKFLDWFYKSKLGQLWLSFLLYRKQTEFEREFSNAFQGHANIEIVQDTNQHKYQEGIATLKKAVSGRADLVMTQELIELAKDETEEQKKFREFRERMYVYKGQDVKNELEKHEMVNKRIAHFYALQKYNEERALLKQIKQARKNNDNDLAERLENDWKQCFRPSIH